MGKKLLMYLLVATCAGTAGFFAWLALVSAMDPSGTTSPAAELAAGSVMAFMFVAAGLLGAYKTVRAYQGSIKKGNNNDDCNENRD